MRQADLQVALMGRPRLVREGVDLSRQIKYRKGVALLGYLAAHPGTSYSREHLADLLWPNLDLGAARTNLRQVLNNLTALLNNGVAVLHKDGFQSSLLPHDGVSIDIALLSDAVLDRVVAGHETDRAWRLEVVEPSALQLGEEFLAGLQFPDTPEFDAWLEAARIQFRGRCALLLEYLCRAQHAEGRLADAIRTARHLVKLAPFDEGHSAQLMSLLQASGEGRAALEVFAELERGLAAEVGVRPADALQALRDDIVRALQETRPAPPPPPMPTALPELRQLAALYCVCRAFDDDGEVEELSAQVETIARQRGGTLVTASGRGVLIVFGLGENSEGASYRALLAGRDLLGLAENLGHMAPRLGISAGRVLLRPAPGGPQLVGEIPDLAALIAWRAEPGALLVSEAVALQLGDLFEFSPLESCLFPGIDGPQSLFRPQDLARPKVREEVSLIGRDAEIGELSARWQEACDARAGVLVVRAIAGMGKTRLAARFAQWVATQGGAVRWVQCALEYQHQPLAAILTAGFRGQTTEQTGKRALFAAVASELEASARLMPTLVVVDDMHWADEATKELVGMLVRGLHRQRLLLLVTSRPEDTNEAWSAQAPSIELQPLSLDASLAMIAAYDFGNEIARGAREEMAKACGGIPLFLERQVRGHLEGGHHRLSITELLQGELDRLDADKHVLQAASVLGNRFGRSFLELLVPAPALSAGLNKAAERSLITQDTPETYVFRHALIRDVAYESIPLSRRRSLHEQVARMLSQSDWGAHGEVARHYSAAGCVDLAINSWIQAGDAEMASDFGTDAMVSFRQALALLQGNAHADKSLVRSVRVRLGHAAQMAEGYGSPLNYQLFADMVAEMEKEPEHDKALMFSALSGCYMGSASLGREGGISLARRLQTMAVTDAGRLMTCFALGNTLFWLGEYVEAAKWQREGIALASTMPLSERIRYCVDDPAVTCRAFHCWTLWFLGEEEAACAMADEAVALARQGERIHALCFALSFAVGMHWTRGDVPKVVEFGSESLALAKQYGFPLWESVDSLFLLWAQIKSGDHSGSALLHQAAAMLQHAMPGRIMTARWIVVLALLEQEQWLEAEQLIDVALEDAGRQEEQYSVPDFLRMKAICLARRGDRDGAANYRDEAQKLAEKQGAFNLLERLSGRMS